MFIWDFLADNVLGQIFDWLYARVVEAFGEFFGKMNDMGAQLFDWPWTQAIVEFFSRFGWALYLVGLVVAVFEYAIESQSGRGDIKAVATGAIKGFFAVNLFTALPVALYQFCVTLQVSLSSDVTSLLGTPEGIAATAAAALNVITGVNQIFLLFFVIALGYCVFKVFFANLKRGGIMLIQIAVGSLYMFSIPRGFTDGFMNWCKQIMGLCLTTFLQSTILIAGLMIFKNDMLMGTGVLLTATEVPRICGAFGLDTSTKANVMGAVYNTQSLLNTTKTIVGGFSKGATYGG